MAVFSSFAGLPLHPIVIHLVVVLGPLAALCAIAYAVRAPWRRALRWPTLALAAITGGASFVAKESGKALARAKAIDVDGKPDITQPVVRRVVEHASAGDRAFLVSVLFLFLTLAIVGWVLPAKGPNRVGESVRRASQILLVLVSIALLFVIISAGHSGALAVWG